MSKRIPKEKPKTRLVVVKLEERLDQSLDQAVAVTDSDRSKFTRVALRERIARVMAGGAR